MAPFFGFLASLAAPLLKPVASLAWEGVKSLGRDLLGTAKTRGVELAKSTVTTLGQSISDKLNTVGQTGQKMQPVIETRVDDDLNQRMNKLQQQEQFIPQIQQMRNPNDISYQQQSGMYKNAYPSFTHPRSFSQKRFQNIPRYGFSDAINRQNFTEPRLTNTRFQSDTSFNTPQVYTQDISNFRNAVQQQQDMQNEQLGYTSQFERGGGGDEFVSGEDYGDKIRKKFHF